MKSIICICLLVISINCDIQTVSELNIEAYLGDWYEVVSSVVVHLVIEMNGYCSRATYQTQEDGNLSVINLQRQGSPQGELGSIKGFAYQTDVENYPGKLKVNFGTGLPSDYWIVQLGPIVDGMYDYTIISEPRRQFMWVLSRDPATYYQKYGSANKEFLTVQLGFTGVLSQYVERDWTQCLPFDN